MFTLIFTYRIIFFPRQFITLHYYIIWEIATPDWSCGIQLRCATLAFFEWLNLQALSLMFIAYSSRKTAIAIPKQGKGPEQRSRTIA